MRTVDAICESLRMVQDSEEAFRLEKALADADKKIMPIFSKMSANDAFQFRDARKVVQKKLDRIKARKP